MDIRNNAKVEDYKQAADYFLGSMSLAKNLITPAKKYYLSYIKNVPTGTYSLNIAYDLMNMVLTDDEAVLVSKIFLANKKYDEAIVTVKDTPVKKSWTYLAMAYYYKNDIKKFKSVSAEGYSKYCKYIPQEDLKTFTDFFLSIQKDYEKALSELKKSNANAVIPDYLMFKTAQVLPQDKKIEEYKNIVKKYSKSEYIPDCLEYIFYDFVFVAQKYY